VTWRSANVRLIAKEPEGTPVIIAARNKFGSIVKVLKRAMVRMHYQREAQRTEL